MPDDRLRSTALPIHMQISELLVREIAAGRLVDGERLPPEREMAQTHGTTVRTLRKALATLEAQGLLERRQGSGNYVHTNPSAQSVYSMFRLELADGGGLPSADVLDLAYLAKPADLPVFGTSASGTRIRRLRHLNATPVACEEIWLDGDSGRIREADITDSLYQTYKTRLGFWIARAEDRVSVGPVPDWAPSEFGPAPGQTVGFVERFGWAQGSRPVEFSRTWFDPDRARYVQRLV